MTTALKAGAQVGNPTGLLGRQGNGQRGQFLGRREAGTTRLADCVELGVAAADSLGRKLGARPRCARSSARGASFGAG